jgi:hypothetical protein
MAEWVFDTPLPSQKVGGGSVSGKVFEATLDTFVREIVQNCVDRAQENDAGTKQYPVDVSFRVEELTGEALDEFKDRIRWDQLEPHLRSTSETGRITIAPRLRGGLEQARERLRVLVVEDRGTEGLTGAESGDGNFANLCKNDLVTGAEGNSGGTFGLGKSVLWLFSSLATVLFSSRPEDRDDLRMFGRTQLASHTVDGDEWEGSGYLGIPTDGKYGRYAHSIGGEPEASELALAWRMPREAGDFGTSVMVLGFQDPSRDEEQSVEQLCAGLRDTVIKWYWPALDEGLLRAEFVGVEGGAEVFQGEADLEDSALESVKEIKPFVEAVVSWRDEDLQEELEAPGSVIRRDLPVMLPGRSETNELGSSEAGSASAKLLLRMATHGEAELKTLNEVARRRGGAGMIVSYDNLGPARIPGPGYHGVLLAGTAAGESEADQEFERFLRASEPPAHNEWDPQEDRLKEEYESYRRVKAIRDLKDGIQRTLSALNPANLREDEEIPEFLRRLMPFGGSGKKDPFSSGRLSDVETELAGGKWQFSGTFTRSSAPRKAWGLKVQLLVYQEGRAEEVIPIEEIRFASSDYEQDEPVEVAVGEIPRGVNEVPFEGESVMLDIPDPERAGVVLVVEVTKKGEGRS